MEQSNSKEDQPTAVGEPHKDGKSVEENVMELNLAMISNECSETTTNTSSTSTVMVEQLTDPKVEDSSAAQALPDGYSMMIAEDGQQYVTVEQDGQVYAIPAAEFQTLQQAAGADGILTIQDTQPDFQSNDTVQVAVQPNQKNESIQSPANTSAAQTVFIPVSGPPPIENLQPLPGPPPFVKDHQKQQSTQKIRTVDLSKKILRPIRVDNWGIFLLSRLQTFFQNKDLCDLTLRFPDHNAQIKAHKLVVNACTDFFIEKENEGALVNGVIDMPQDFVPDAVAPIIRFMYTGRLELKTSMFAKLHSTALRLKMSVLTKLIDAQLSATDSNEAAAKTIKKPRPFNDPIRQMKKIQRIEKKVLMKEKKAKAMARMQEKKEEYGSNTIPGKKLPIWKRRFNQNDTHSSSPSVPVTSVQKTAASTPTKLNLKPVDSLPSGVKAIPLPKSEKSSLDSTPSVTPSPKSYRRHSQLQEKPKIPRKIREIQENLTFEKVRRSGSKNPATFSTQIKEPKKDMTVEEMREFMEEQRKRLAQMEEFGGDMDDDYFDNDAGFEFGEDEYEENYDDEEAIDNPSDNLAPCESEKSTPTTMKPILRNEPLSSGPRKSVRFSLRAATAPTDILGSSKVSTLQETAQRGSKQPDRENDEFTPIMKKKGEMIEQNEVSSNKRGRPRKSDSPSAKKPRIESGNSMQKSLPSEESKKTSFKTNSELSESELAQQILKENPDILKGKEQVKLKVVTKDSQGREKIKVITLKAVAPHHLSQTISKNGKQELSLDLDTAEAKLSSGNCQATNNVEKNLKEQPQTKSDGQSSTSPMEFTSHQKTNETIEAAMEQLHSSKKSKSPQSKKEEPPRKEVINDLAEDWKDDDIE